MRCRRFIGALRDRLGDWLHRQVARRGLCEVCFVSDLRVPAEYDLRAPAEREGLLLCRSHLKDFLSSDLAEHALARGYLRKLEPTDELERLRNAHRR